MNVFSQHLKQLNIKIILVLCNTMLPWIFYDVGMHLQWKTLAIALRIKLRASFIHTIQKPQIHNYLFVSMRISKFDDDLCFDVSEQEFHELMRLRMTLYKDLYDMRSRNSQKAAGMYNFIINIVYMNKTHNHILLSIKNSKKVINAEGSKYPLVKEIALQHGFQVGSEFFTLYWTDHALTIKQIRDIPLHIRINHFPEITTLTRKNKMANVLNSMLRYFPKEYDFYPETFIFPMDYATLVKKHQKQKYYIIKPENGCQGKGIYLTNSISQIQKSSSVIVQRYINNPLLIDNLKFDLRVYVLITSVQPLRIFLFKEGMVRFATQAFEQPSEDNLGNLFRHLTNYAINKNHQEFKVNDSDFSKGHKRLLSTLFDTQAQNSVHKGIADIVIKSIIAALPNLQNALMLSKKDSNINSCFQLLGFDILVTDNKKLKLLEINQNPSLMTDTPIDKSLKGQLLSTLFAMLESTYEMRQEKNESKLRIKDRKQFEKAGNFARIYPCETVQQTQTYDHLIAKSQELFRDKFGLGTAKQPKKQSKEQIEHIPWNESSEFYSKQKLSKVYGGGRIMRTSHKRRLVFY